MSSCSACMQKPAETASVTTMLSPEIALGTWTRKTAHGELADVLSPSR